MNTNDSSRSTGSLRGFWSFFATQFQGAFSDNVLKNLAIFVALFGTTMSLADKNGYGESISALFSLPFILFSMAGGFLADRFSKRSVMLGVKIFELAIMSVVLFGLWQLNKNVLLACVFLMGTHSAFFGPSKYGSLPELLPEPKLSWGNGILELGTFVAIILGTAAAAILSQRLEGREWVSGFILIGLAVFGFCTCLGITRVPAANPAKQFNANFPAEVWKQIRAMRGDRPLWLALIGNTYFQFLGALLLLNVFFYGAYVLGVKETQISYLTVALALGIGVGSVSAGYLSGGKIEYGLVPLGAVGLSLFSILLALPHPTVTRALVLLALLGFSGGFFIVPISALLQHKPAREIKGEVLATANWCSFVGSFAASGAHWLLAQQLHFSPRAIFLTGGVLTFAGAIYVLWLLPDALLRFMLWILTRTVYRIRVINSDHIPARGGALFVSNHLSLADGMLLLASTDRKVRFMLYKAHYELPWIKPFARMLGVIPISSEQRPREMLKSLQAASDAIKNGDIVCIFAEGQITRIGQMMPFRRGFERIMKDVEAPIIPVALGGVWGSIFSFERGRFIWKWPRHFPHPVTVNYGKPMPHTATPFEVRQAVQELQAEAWVYRKPLMKTLHRSFIRTARTHPFRFAMADAQNKKVKFGSALIRTIFLARRLKKIGWGERPREVLADGHRTRPTNSGVNQKMVGLLLPPSVPGALVNFAVLLSGRVPVNLNYTVSEETLASCIHQCDIKTVITSKTFLEKVKLKVPCQTVFLEDLAGAPSTRSASADEPQQAEQVLGAPSVWEKLTAVFMAFFLPAGLLERALGREKKVTLDDLATVIFSSGSTGEPKGVMLSHYNVAANIEQLEQVFGLGTSDCVLGVLPFFHSFGFTGTLFLPAVVGVGAVYHPNPLDAKTIGPLVNEYAATFLLATPTFLQLYMRGCSPEDFGSLRVVMTGAEKLPDRLAAAFEEHFGIRPLEGYGCTECAPAVAVNTHDFRSAGFRQVGTKRGKIGHPLAGVSVRIVDPDTRAPQPMGQPGLMLVRGPNVMQGYLGKPEKTGEVLRDGWYVTGDIAAIDEDGFLQITDRLSRFSKIGGEMVPHIKVEERLHELAGATEQTFVVAGVPDEKKGERLVVLHKLPDARLQEVLEKLSQTDLPNLWKPRADQFFRVESFPLLGTGKLDLRKVKDIAAQFASKTVVETAQPA